MSDPEIDLAVVGGGPAGLSAALTAARDGWRAGVFDAEGGGGRLYKLDVIHDYPTANASIAGPDLAAGMVEAAFDAGVDIVFDRVESVAPGDGWTVTVAGSARSARAVVLATGQADAVLGMPQEQTLRGHGLSYCATCDGPLFVGKRVAVYGAGGWAVDEAVLLARHATTTLICPATTLRVPRWRRQLLAEHGVRLIEGATLARLDGDRALTAVDITTASGPERLELEGFFPIHGLRPDVGAAPSTVVGESGVIVDRATGGTSLAGLFAAGDVTHTDDGLVSAAIAAGVRAGTAAGLYLQGIL